MKIKKIIIMALIFTMFSTFIVSAQAAEWKIGYSGQTISKVQGVDNWYYMYSNSTNQAGNFPVNTFKNCIWDETISNWKYYSPQTDRGVWGVPAESIDKSVWNPTKKPNPVTNVWFQINSVDPFTDDNKDGEPDGVKGIRADPITWIPLETGKGTGLTPAIKWVAPVKGDFALKAEYKAGSSVGDWQDAWGWTDFDGVYISIFKNSTSIYGKNFGFNKTTDIEPVNFVLNTVNKDVNMNAGDSLYFICDPKVSGMHDSSLWMITITEIEAGSSSVPSSSTNTLSSRTSSMTSSASTSGNTSVTVSSSVSATSSQSNASGSAASGNSEDLSDGIPASDISGASSSKVSKVTVVSADWEYPSSQASSDPTSDSQGKGNPAMTAIIIAASAAVVAGGSIAGYFAIKKRKIG